MFNNLNIYLMFKKSIFLVVSFLALTIASCKKDDDAISNTVSFDVSLSGTNEVPANTNKTTKMLSYTLTYSGFTPTAGHFHTGAAGNNGGVAADLGAISNGMKNTITLTDAQATDLMNGMWYLNLHSTAFPGGEIRGQIILK
jgi:hypothetical protein